MNEQMMITSRDASSSATAEMPQGESRPDDRTAHRSGQRGIFNAPDQDEAMDVDPAPPRPPSYQTPKPRADMNWADEMESEETAKARSTAKKSKKKEKRKTDLAKARADAEEAKARGDPPPKPCRRCKGPHWTQDCLEPDTDPDPSTPTPNPRRLTGGDLITPSKLFPSQEDQDPAPTVNADASLPKQGTYTPKEKGKKRPRQDSTAGTGTLTTQPAAKKGAAKGLGKKKGKKSGDAAPQKSQDVVIKLTRLEESGNSSRDPRFADGKHLFLGFPQEIRNGSVQLPEVVEALFAGILTPGELIQASDTDSSGWVLQCSSEEVVERVIGQQISLQGYAVALAPYVLGGAKVYICDHTRGTKPEEVLTALVEKVEQVQKKASVFWMGYQEFRGVRGDKIVLVFRESPGIATVDFTIGVARPGYTKAFMAKFRAVSLTDKVCAVCKGRDMKPHQVFECSHLQTTRRPEALNMRRCELLSSPPTSSILSDE